MPQNPPAQPVQPTRAPLVAWGFAYALLLVTMLAAIPSGVALNSRLTDLHLPTEEWSPEDLRRSLAALGLSEHLLPVAGYALLMVIGLVCAGVAGIIVWRRPGDRGVLTTSILLTAGAWGVTGTHLSLEAALPAAQVPLRVVGMIAFECLTLLLYVFPDGRFVPRWTRWPAALAVAMAPLNVFDSPVNPTTWPGPVRLTLSLALLAIPLWSQVYRYRSVRDPVQRRQTSWVVLSVILFLLGTAPVIVLTLTSPALLAPGPAGLRFHIASNVWLSLLALLVPVAIGISALRLRLWQAEPLLNRTLVLGLLTLLLGGLYTVVLGLLGALFQTTGQTIYSLLAAGCVAVLFGPLRRWAQGLVNRLMYGERDDPYGLVSRLAARLQTSVAPDAVVRSIVQTVREAFRLPSAAVELAGPNGAVVAAVVDPPGPAAAPRDVREADGVRRPLSFRGEVVGWLSVPPAPDGEALSPRDEKLLDELARHSGAAVYALRAAAQVQHAHDRMLAVTQEERRRLRRELHDVLGPMIATLAMKLDVASAVGGSDPDRAHGLLAEARAELRGMLELVRRLVYGLYPPVLDQLGLAGAIREHAQTVLEPAGVTVVCDLPDATDPLPAAVEVAAFRIAAEALTNVQRHAAARTCWVRLAEDDGRLRLDITDDGRGLGADFRPGVGLHAIRERASELGGDCLVDTITPSGTRVSVHLPTTLEDR